MPTCKASSLNSITMKKNGNFILEGRLAPLRLIPLSSKSVEPTQMRQLSRAMYKSTTIFFLLLILSLGSWAQTTFSVKVDKSALSEGENRMVKALPFHTDTLPFVLTQYNNMLIEAVLNQVDTVQLMFHTAASGVNIIAASTPKATSLQFDRTLDGASAWGGGGSLRVSEGNEVAMGNLSWEGMEIHEDERSGHLSDGKFGLDLFDGKVVEIDFEKSWLLIHNQLPALDKGFQRAAVTFQDFGMFMNGQLDLGDGKLLETEFLVHSGYSGTLLVEDEFVATHQLGEKLETLSEKELKDAFGNAVKTKRASLPVFRIGEYTFKEIPIGFFEGTIGRQRMSVMGGDMLKRFHLVMDLREEKVYLKANALNQIAYSDY